MAYGNNKAAAASWQRKISENINNGENNGGNGGISEWRNGSGEM